MPAIYKGSDVYVEVKTPKPYSAYTARKAYLIFPAQNGTLELKTTTALDGTAVVTPVVADGQALPVVIFRIGDELTKIADTASGTTLRLFSNTSGYLEVRLTESDGDLVILTVPLGPVIDTTIKSLA